MSCECRHTRSSRLACSLRHVRSGQVPLGIFNIMPSWRRVLTVGCSFAALCVARDMNMFLARGVTIVLFLYLLRCTGLKLRLARRSSHLGRWLEGLWACPCTSQLKKAIRLERQGTGSCPHGRRLYFDGPHQCFVVHTSVPLPQVGREARARILVMAKEVSMCCDRNAENGLFRCIAKFTSWGLQLISNTSVCNHLKDASIAVWGSSAYVVRPSVLSARSHQGNRQLYVRQEF